MFPVARVQREGIHCYGYETEPEIPLYDDYFEHLISAEGPDRYTKQDAALLETVREPIAIALSNARRYRELVRVRDLLAEDNRALSADLKRIAGVEVVGQIRAGTRRNALPG